MKGWRIMYGSGWDTVDFSGWLLLNISATLVWWIGSIYPKDGWYGETMVMWPVNEQPNPTQARSGSVMFKSNLLPIKVLWVSPNFSPVISDQYLFIFVKLEEDNICLFYNLPFGQTHRYVLMSLAIVKLVLVCYGQVCRYSVLTSLMTKITRSFSCLESLKRDKKKTPRVLFHKFVSQVWKSIK